MRFYDGDEAHAFILSVRINGTHGLPRGHLQPDRPSFDHLATPLGTSAAEEIQSAAASGVRVVKAFNTTFAGLLGGTGQVAGLPLDVFIAGDDAEAKRVVSDLVSAGKMRPMDVGPLRRARELEAFQFLHMTIQEPLGLGWSSAIKILPERIHARYDYAAKAGAVCGRP